MAVVQPAFQVILKTTVTVVKILGLESGRSRFNS
jgi:hypothetical protein